MLRAASTFLLMTPLVVMQKEGGKPVQTQMQVRKEDVKYLPEEEGQHFKRKTLLSSSAVVGNKPTKFHSQLLEGFLFIKTSGFEWLL